jgi:hypothetical protein
LRNVSAQYPDRLLIVSIERSKARGLQGASLPIIRAVPAAVQRLRMALRVA